LSHGTLYVVATPIGNLEDLTPRARRTLSEVDLIAAEDTRHTAGLLSHFGIKTRQLSLHEHNEARASAKILDLLREGASVALVSDAGTPLISDPGYTLVRLAHEAGIPVRPVPGASALTAAMSVAGIASDRFLFEGFLPARGEARRARLKALAGETMTLVFYESVHRVADCLSDMRELFGEERIAFLGREISKMHEQYLRGDLGSLAGVIESGEVERRGEFVIVVAGSDRPAPEMAGIDPTALLRELVDALPGKQAVDVVSRLSGRRRNDVYRAMLALKGEGRD